MHLQAGRLNSSGASCGSAKIQRSSPSVSLSQIGSGRICQAVRAHGKTDAASFGDKGAVQAMRSSRGSQGLRAGTVALSTEDFVASHGSRVSPAVSYHSSPAGSYRGPFHEFVPHSPTRRRSIKPSWSPESSVSALQSKEKTLSSGDPGAASQSCAHPHVPESDSKEGVPLGFASSGCVSESTLPAKREIESELLGTSSQRVSSSGSTPPECSGSASEPCLRTTSQKMGEVSKETPQREPAPEPGSAVSSPRLQSRHQTPRGAPVAPATPLPLSPRTASPTSPLPRPSSLRPSSRGPSAPGPASPASPGAPSPRPSSPRLDTRRSRAETRQRAARSPSAQSNSPRIEPRLTRNEATDDLTHKTLSISCPRRIEGLQGRSDRNSWPTVGSSVARQPLRRDHIIHFDKPVPAPDSASATLRVSISTPAVPPIFPDQKNQGDPPVSKAQSSTGPHSVQRQSSRGEKINGTLKKRPPALSGQSGKVESSCENGLSHAEVTEHEPSPTGPFSPRRQRSGRVSTDSLSKGSTTVRSSSSKKPPAGESVKVLTSRVQSSERVGADPSETTRLRFRHPLNSDSTCESGSATPSVVQQSALCSPSSSSGCRSASAPRSDQGRATALADGASEVNAELAQMRKEIDRARSELDAVLADKRELQRLHAERVRARDAMWQERIDEQSTELQLQFNQQRTIINTLSQELRSIRDAVKRNTHTFDGTDSLMSSRTTTSIPEELCPSDLMDDIDQLLTDECELNGATQLVSGDTLVS
mmetsp:Transcript_34268/g.91519  ORF Transcript_34268/g.91519 Transcript_34268/m.91519 type:complete len:762 (-) Transcript_34268:185-2470(-)